MIEGLHGSECPEALHHGPADARGRCPWCGRKFTNAVAHSAEGFTPSDLTTAYEYTYDPDHGTRTKDEIRRRYEMGLDS